MLLVTHDGRFQYGELLVTAILARILTNVTVIRTKDEEIIDRDDIVYDVSNLFNPKIRRFDHHKNTFSETFS